MYYFSFKSYGRTEESLSDWRPQWMCIPKMITMNSKILHPREVKNAVSSNGPGSKLFAPLGSMAEWVTNVFKD